MNQMIVSLFYSSSSMLASGGHLIAMFCLALVLADSLYYRKLSHYELKQSFFIC